MISIKHLNIAVIGDEDLVSPKPSSTPNYRTEGAFKSNIAEEAKEAGIAVSIEEAEKIRNLMNDDIDTMLGRNRESFGLRTLKDAERGSIKNRLVTDIAERMMK